jgi:DNA-binding LacI/PurR family transcriptional regulator
VFTVRAAGGGEAAREELVAVAASLKDVAARAGVSVKTVSNVVNDYPFVTPETRAKVQRVIEELGYRPNLSARQLRAGRTGLIALAVPEIKLPYFAELADQVVTQAKPHGWTVLIEQTRGERDAERVVAEGITSHLVDGLIVSLLALTARDIERRRDRTPLVLLGERLTEAPIDHVSIDNVAAARLATEHLIGLGRRRIAAIGAQPHVRSGTASFRLQGYREALRQAGLRYDRTLVAPAARYHRLDGAEAMARLLDAAAPPDAVFCFNDTLALGALRALLARGVRVPEDVAVVGFDDIEEARFATPSLTTIAPDKRGIAELALGLLDTRIGARGAAGPQVAEAGFTLQIRESTTGPTPNPDTPTT